MKRIYFVLVTIHMTLPNLAQHQDVPDIPDLWKGHQTQTIDTTSLLHAFRAGQMHGHFRYFFMATDNKKGLSDYYAHAVGGGIKYETAPFKGFQLGVSGFFVFNTGSSDLGNRDAKTGQPNRYETGLFDINDPHNKTDIDHLEELYLTYNWKQSHVKLGKQLINTSFINLQDGRMRPTEVGGLTTAINSGSKKTKIVAGYLYEMSPRSTVTWYRTGESIGIFSQGVHTDGTAADYRGNLYSKGVAFLESSHQLGHQMSAKISDVFVDNIFNTLLLQWEYSGSLKDESKIIAAAQFIRQDGVKDGGNPEPLKSYFQRGGQSNVLGAKLGMKKDSWYTSFSYTRITGHGRYLMPREWGREPFFTYLPRERNEGLGDVHAYVVRLGYNLPNERLKTEIGLGYFNLPAVTRYTLNKYGLPPYAQLNMDIRYEFTSLLQGLGTQLLWVYKRKAGKSFVNDIYVINKVDMMMWNILVNYHF